MTVFIVTISYENKFNVVNLLRRNLTYHRVLKLRNQVEDSTCLLVLNVFDSPKTINKI